MYINTSYLTFKRLRHVVIKNPTRFKAKERRKEKKRKERKTRKAYIYI
jgi:hypothetical protein